MLAKYCRLPQDGVIAKEDFGNFGLMPFFPPQLYQNTAWDFIYIEITTHGDLAA